VIAMANNNLGINLIMNQIKDMDFKNKDGTNILDTPKTSL
jgi:outer membrane receptor for Fe3+-dicitrate